jgi:hypothetical protein
MRTLVLSLSLALAACDAGGAAEEAPGGPPTLTGVYVAASNTARDATGGESVQPGGMIIEKGVVLYTRTHKPRSAMERIARDGDSYAAIAVIPTDLTIDLRRVTEQTVAPGKRGLCGDTPPGYVALAYGERATTVTLLVFAGDEPPGPNATRSRLCATLAYATPGGARTSQGVVLW